MVRKNVELELQALVLLQYQLGLIKIDNELTNAATNDDEIMSIVIKKSRDEYEALMNSRQSGRSQSTTAAAAGPDLPVQKPQDLETAKKLVKSERLAENLKQELNQQDHINRKLVRDELRNNNAQPAAPSSHKEAFGERPASAAKRNTANAGSGGGDQLRDRFQNMKFNEESGSSKSHARNVSKKTDEDDEDILIRYNNNSKPNNAASSASPSSSSTAVTNDLTHALLTVSLVIILYVRFK
jgi:hypothetical protein